MRFYTNAAVFLATVLLNVSNSEADWTALGPSPIISSPISSYTGVEGMPSYGNPSVGAMNIALEAPGNPSILYVGTTNGGVWKSPNAGLSWEPLTDKLSSLSIGDMSFDRNNPSKLYIGFGRQSNYASLGGPLNGIMLSTDGGDHWSSPDKGNTLVGKDIVKMFVDKNLMLVGITNPGTNETGLYRSDNGGGVLAAVSTDTGLAAGTISDLKADLNTKNPDYKKTFYASVINNIGESGIYKSTDSGASWKLINNNITTVGSTTERILLATTGNTLVAEVVNGIAYDQTVFYRSTNGGVSWTSMTQPVTNDHDKENGLLKQGLFPSDQFNNAALAIDPKNTNIIYVSGVRQPDNGTNAQFPNSIGANAYSGRIFRGVYDPATNVTTWEPLTNNGTTNNSSPHADSRSIFIDSAGRLIQTDDGGIYSLSNPQGKGQWTPLLGNIRVSEVDASSWNPLANIAVAGMQDNGSVYQIKGSTRWGMISAGDGGANAVNSQTLSSNGDAVIYGSNQHLGGLVRFNMASDGAVDPDSITPITLYKTESGKQIDLNNKDAMKDTMPFYPALVLNKYVQTRFAVGGFSLFTGTDDPSKNNSDGIRLQVQEIVKSTEVTGVTNDGFGSIAYGAKDRHNAILGGVGDQQFGALSPAEISKQDRYGQLWYSDDANKTAPVRLTNFDTVDLGGKPGRSVQSLVFDGNTGSSNFYVADGATIWRGTRNNDWATLYNFDSVSASLPANFIARRAVEYVAFNGVNALLAGGLHNSTTETDVNPIYYTLDPAKNNGAAWNPLGKLLPNAPIFALQYSATDDVLLASTLGRGLFATFDFTSYFSEATNLLFGKADNNSNPDASLLTDGTPVGGGASFSRALIKTGAGTLTLPNAATTYTGGTQFNGGTIAAYQDASFGTGNWSFASGKLQYLAAFNSARLITLNTDGGTFDTNSYASTLSGVVSGNGAFTKGGAGTLTLSGNNTYTGTTTVNAGTLKAGVGSVANISGAFGNNSAVILANDASTNLDITGFNTQIGSITGGGETGGNVMLGAKILTVGGDDSSPAAYAGVISGADGAISKIGTGTQIFSGANTYTGGTTISAGILRADNSHALGTGAVNNNATLDIGSTTLNIGGTYTQGASAASRLMVAVSGDSNGSILSVGKATVHAANSLVLDVSYVPDNTKYTIIKGATGGAIAAPIINWLGNNRATFVATTTGDELILTSNRAANGFASDANPGDANARAVGTEMDNIHNPSTDMSLVLNTMDGLSKSQTAAALDTLVPEVDAGVINTDRATLNNFTGVSIDRVEKAHTEGQSKRPARSGVSSGEADKLDGLWAKGYGSYLAQGMRGGIAGYNAWNAGTALGVDHRFTDAVTLGISGGYAYGNVNSDANSANTTINSAQTTLYGGYQDQKRPFFIDTAVSFAYNWYAGRRNINVGNVILRTANGSYDGQQYGAYLGGGYKFKFADAIEVTPLVSLQYNNLHINSYAETGAGALNLNAGTQNYNQLQSGLGGRIATTLSSQWGKVTPELHSKWLYDFFGDPFAVTSNFNGGGAAFGANGAKPAVNSFNVGGELKLDLKDEIAVIGKVDTQLRQGFSGVFGSFTVRF